MDTGWRTAVDEQIALLGFLRSRAGKRFVAGFAEADHEPAAVIERALDVSLRTAEPVFMSPDAFAIVDSARRSFQPEPILPTDLFIPAGFLLEQAKVWQRWAVTRFAPGSAAGVARFSTEAEARSYAGLKGGSTDPDYRPAS